MKKRISIIISLFLNVICFGQSIPNLKGEYFIQNNNAMLYIFDNNEFLVLGYETAVKGKIEIRENQLEFKNDHNNSEFLLYGRKSLNRQIILNENAFRYNLYFADHDNGKSDILLNEVQKEKYNYCSSYCYSFPLKRNTDKVLFKTDQEKNYLAYFKINEKYDEYLLKYLVADADIDFLEGIFKIQGGELFFNKNVIKKTLNLTKEIKYIIEKLNQVDLVFNQEKIFLDENFKVVMNKEIDLSQYSFNASKNEYIKRTSDKELNVLYQFTKIDSEVKPNVKYKISSIDFIDTVCLKTPKTILEENEDRKRKNKAIPVMEMVE
ncbi:hypothetical protein [Flavobacterium plurextorum]|nr:hypothetical protein [Flavobacterium plurextorum]